MAAADPQAVFLTPPPAPRHLAELRIDTAPSAVAFSAPCGAEKGAGRRKRRCLVPASSVRKRMLLELDPFVDVAPSPSSTPPPMPSPPPTPAVEFSFGTVLRPPPPASPGNIFAFLGNAARTPAESEARSAMSISASLGMGQAAPAGVSSFLAAPKRPKTPTVTGPTPNGGFVFAVPQEAPLTPSSTNTSGALSFLASPRQPVTPMGSTATGGGILAPAVPLLIPLKPARNDTGVFAFPSPGPPCSQIGSAPSAAIKEKTPLAGLTTPPFVYTISQPPPCLRKTGHGSDKRPSLFLRRAATTARRFQQLEEQPPQKVAKTNAAAAGEPSRSAIMSGSAASPCCMFFTSTSKEAAKQEAMKAFSEASGSPAGSRCSSPVWPASPEKENKQGREVEASSSDSEVCPNLPGEHTSPSPAVVCSCAEMVVRVTCKCGVHKEFCLDRRL